MRRGGALHPTPLCTQLCDIAERMAESGIGFIWRHGTGRHDAVKRVPVAEMNTCYNEVAFALAGETSVVTDAFLAAGADYGRMQDEIA